jgi:cyclin L
MIIGETADDFYLDVDEVSAPSERDGVPRAQERAARARACDLIISSTALLEHPPQVAITACVLFHRFFCRRSMQQYSVNRAAAAALWLAAKLQEVPDVSSHPAVLLHKVLLVFDRVCTRREQKDAAPPPPPQAITPTASPPILERHSREYLALRDSVVRHERELLRACGYVCAVEAPHQLVLSLLQVVRQEALAPRAWALANDSLRTTLCVRVRPLGVACGVVFIAARQAKVALPGEGGGGGDDGCPPWYEVLGASADQVATVARDLDALYSGGPEV